MSLLNTLCKIGLLALLTSIAHADGHLFGKKHFGDYALDKTHAYIAFTYSHQGYSKPVLHFRAMDAALTLPSDDFSQAEVEVTIQASSIDSGVDKFNSHLVGEDFFKVARYPEIRFRSTSIEPGEGKNFIINGELTIKGITRPVKLDALLNKAGSDFQLRIPRIGFSANTVIKRSLWNLGKYVPIVGDEVTVTLEVEFLKQS